MAAPKLQLDVTLNLAAFRKDLGKVAQAAAAYYYPVNLLINKKNFETQLRSLSKIKPVINIEDSQLDGARARIATLNKSLATLRKATASPLEIKIKYTEIGRSSAGGSGQLARVISGKVKAEQLLSGLNFGQLVAARRTMLAAKMPVGDIGRNRSTAAYTKSLIEGMEKAGDDAVAGLAQGLKDGESEIAKAAKQLGQEGLKAFKDFWGIQSPSKKARDEIGKPIGKGIEEGLEQSLIQAQSLNVADLRRYFNALKSETQKGVAQLSALMAAGMAGLVQTPGGMQQRRRIQAAGSTINAAMTGGALQNIQGRQANVRQQTTAASSVSPTVLAALPILMGMKPQELQQRMSGLYGQQYRAPGVEGISRPNERRISSLIDLLASTRTGLGAGSGGLVVSGREKQSPGILPTGYRNAAISPAYVNYPPGMPAAYPAGFTGKTAGRFGMEALPFMPMAGMMGPSSPIGSRGRFPMSGMVSPFSPIGSMGRFPMSGMIGRGSTGQFPMAGMMGRGSMGQFPMNGPMAPSPLHTPTYYGGYPSQAHLNTRLSAMGGTTPSFSIYGGATSRFPMAGMMGPSSPLGRITPQSSMFAGGGGGGGGTPPGGNGGGFNFGPNMGRDLGRGFLGGGGGGIAGEIASEFAQATKQVLLFGTAYKALAAITALPGNIINATSNLQSFRNQLEAVTGGGKIMTDSLSLIEDTVARFNMPIESARQGFVRLYASMAPAGISGGTINSIFTGLAGAATTLGMNADQVDRMTYALSQMASKGQITSEELKGQLGDVFPQAVSLFAEAAGFLNDTMDDQAKAKGISSFLKALEDGALRGEAMSKVLTNVGVLLNQDFGPTGEKAAASFKGQIIALNNALTAFYESFAPAASQFLGEFIQPMVQGLTTVGNAIKLALSGEAVTNNPLASYFKNELFPQLNNIKTALLGAGQVLGAFAQSMGAVLRPLAQFLLGNQALVSSIAKGLVVFGTFRAVVAALNTLGIIPLIANIVRYGAVFRIFITQTAAGATGIRALNTAMTQTGLSATAAIGGIRTLAATIRTALVTSAIGIAVVAIGVLIERITQLQAVAESVKARGKGVSTRLTTAAKGGTLALKEEKGNVQAEIATANRLRALYVKGTTKQGLTESELREIEDQGGDISMFSTFGGGNRAITQQEIRRAREAAGLQQRNVMTMQGRLQEALPAAQQNAAVIDRRNAQQTQVNFAGLGASLSGGGASGGGGAEEQKQRESQIPQLVLRLEKTRELSALELQISDATLMNNTAQLSALELAKQLVEFKYEEKELALQELTAGEQSVARQEIGLRREQAILASQLQLQVDFKKERDAVQQGFVGILAGYDEEFEYQQMYLNLINQGIRPSLAKARVEVEKTFKAEEKRLDTLIEQHETNIAGLKVDIARFKLKKDLSPVEQQQLKDAEERLRIAEQELALSMGMKDVVPQTKAAAMEKAEQGLAPKTVAEYLSEGYEEADDNLKQLANLGYQVVNAANAIGDAFSESFKGIISGSMTAQQALASFFQSVGDYFVDMAARMIAEWVKMQIIGLVQSLLAPVAGGFAGGLSSGFSAGTSSAIDTSGAGWGAAFSTPLKFANGGIAAGGFTAFANGGMVTGPTMGLVGEGRYNEAIVPLPNGKSIPVELGGAAGNQINSNITVNVNNGQAQSNATGSNSSELGRKIEGAVKQVIVGELRPGGLLASSRK